MSYDLDDDFSRLNDQFSQMVSTKQWETASMLHTRAPFSNQMESLGVKKDVLVVTNE